MKPALRRIIRDEHTLQYGAHPLQAVMLSGLTEAVRQWIEGLDGTRDLKCVLKEAAAAGLDEIRARSLLDELAAQGALHDAATSPAPIADLPLAERDRLRPDLDALDLASTAPDGAIGLIARRRERRVRVYGAGRVGAQVVALLAASGVGNIRILDPATARPCDITPGGLTWTEVGLPREVGAATIARRLTSGGHTPTARRSPAATTPPAPLNTTRAAQGNRTPQTEEDNHIARAREGAHSAPPPEGTQPASSAPPTRTTQSGQSARSAPSARAAKGAQPTTSARTAAISTKEGSRRGGLEREADESVRRPSVNAMAGGPYLGDQSDRPDLVILTPVAPLDGVLVNELTSLGIPHLLGSAFEGHGTVGPLVIPGKTACLHCLDLTRRDRDPMWPIVTARLGGYPPGETACDVTLAALVAAAVAGHALAYLDGREPAVTNGTMDVTPDWRWKRRSWTIHPQCRCMRNYPYSLRMVMSPNRD
ncbi:thiamine biosynthesis protein ThiF [Nonomuraea jabiensis]|uniref:thiamine biosynthesis protein ThiF n=1 Tax=Nonomuraea jabiensis TaxID=882448 RepID=UPI0036AFFFD5